MSNTLLVTATVFSSFFFGLFGIDWDKIDRRIEREFPTVEFVEQAAMLERILGGNEQVPLLVDVREPEEYAVSHLEDAYNFQTAADIASRFPDRDSDIVVYCSVGYRAAAVAARLQELGYTRVLNLRHAIFEWANNHRPMSNDRGPTERVHPYNRAWASLVNPELRQFGPE